MAVLTPIPARAGASAAAPVSPVAHIGPNWFAAVMGTGIVGIALAGLPVGAPALTVLATGFWLLATVLLVAVSAATAAHHRLHPAVARGHLGDPVLAHFYGAPPMAVLTVGAGALLLGPPLLGDRLAVGASAVLWLVGTLLGLVVAVVVPVVAITRHEGRDDGPGGAWLMPVVPPMVSAATGALLVPHAPAGQPRETLLLVLGACFGVSLLAGSVMIVLLWGRLLRHGVGAPGSVPTVWIALGVLGQSVTAAHHLAVAAGDVLPAPLARAAEVMAVGYGVPVWGFALLWLALAAALTVHTARRGLPFGLPWWSFTFPLGTVVTGTSALAAGTGLVLLDVVAVALMALLLALWSLVAVRTAGGVLSGRLLLPPG